MCFVAHKLTKKIDEDDHLYHENNEIRQTLIENLGFTFIKINLDPDPDAGFNLDVEIAKIYNYIHESSLKLAVKSKERFRKELLNYVSSISGPLEWIKYFMEKVRPTL